MDGSSSRDGDRKNGKRAADQSFTNKVKEPRRGMGIAKLEKMRAEEEMKEKYLKNPFGQTHISGAGIQGMMAHGARGYMNEQFNLPFNRPMINTSGAAASYGIRPRNTVPTTTTLQLFPDLMEDAYVDSKREGDHNIPVEPTGRNSDDPKDQLDLDLKL